MNGLSTLRFAGKYEYGTNPEKGRFGLAYIYAKTDSSILFYLDLNRGKPSYNMGSIWGEVILKKGKGIFSASIKGNTKPCEMSFRFTGNILTIETVNSNDDCGFGYGVIGDGVYKKKSSKKPLYFFDATGAKIYFKDL